MLFLVVFSYTSNCYSFSFLTPTYFFLHSLTLTALTQVEIDEYRDYEKAVGALREALAL